MRLPVNITHLGAFLAGRLCCVATDWCTGVVCREPGTGVMAHHHAPCLHDVSQEVGHEDTGMRAGGARTGR
jgi:hypothetical protein